ncbi:5'/3'-nucleotidase SurE [bacterium]|nr:5'/3'-nucleotidase SurE [bacterium]
MRILITNDDGIQAEGIKALYQSFQGLGEVWVVAPSAERSGVSHAFTIRDPLRVDFADWVKDKRGYGVDGMPVDAVKLAIRSILPGPPDLVISGINSGENTGVDLLYSGTVGAAREGAVFGIPSLAISLTSKKYPDYSVAARFARTLAEKIFEKGVPKGIMLNVNVPAIGSEQIKGVRVTRQAESMYVETVKRKDDQKGGDCYWVEYKKILTGEYVGTDIEAIDENYISITPVHFQLTEKKLIHTIENWNVQP